MPIGEDLRKFNIMSLEPEFRRFFKEHGRSPEDLNKVIVGFVLNEDVLGSLQDSFASLNTVSSMRTPDGPPLWILPASDRMAHPFGLMLRLHDGFDTPRALAGTRGLAEFQVLQKQF
jgi:hypothetical protein